MDETKVGFGDSEHELIPFFDNLHSGLTRACALAHPKQAKMTGTFPLIADRGVDAASIISNAHTQQRLAICHLCFYPVSLGVVDGIAQGFARKDFVEG